MKALIPNGFLMPNFIVDDVMPQLTDDEFKVLIIVVKETSCGINRVIIDIADFMHYTGLNMNEVEKAVEFLERIKLIVRNATTYRMNGLFDPDLVDFEHFRRAGGVK
jgi:hypothetical protein